MEFSFSAGRTGALLFSTWSADALTVLPNKIQILIMNLVCKNLIFELCLLLNCLILKKISHYIPGILATLRKGHLQGQVAEFIQVSRDFMHAMWRALLAQPSNSLQFYRIHVKRTKVNWNKSIEQINWTNHILKYCKLNNSTLNILSVKHYQNWTIADWTKTNWN